MDGCFCQIVCDNLFADMIDKAIAATLAQGLRTGDIMQPNMRKVGTSEMGKAILKEVERLAG